MLDYVSTFQITGEQWTAYKNELPPSFFFFGGGAAFVANMFISLSVVKGELDACLGTTVRQGAFSESLTFKALETLWNLAPKEINK